MREREKYRDLQIALRVNRELIVAIIKQATWRERARALLIFWRSFFTPRTRPCVGKNCTGQLAERRVSQNFGCYPSASQISWACKIFGMAAIGCNPNAPLDFHSKSLGLLSVQERSSRRFHSVWIPFGIPFLRNSKTRKNRN